MFDFVQNRKKREMEIFAFRVIMFEPIKIYTCLASQNDRLNLSFVKDENTVGKKCPFILSDSFPIRVYIIFYDINREFTKSKVHFFIKHRAGIFVKLYSF